MASLTLTDRSVPETGTEESIPQALCQFVEAQAQKAGTDGAAAHLENISERLSVRPSMKEGDLPEGWRAEKIEAALVGECCEPAGQASGMTGKLKKWISALFIAASQLGIDVTVAEKAYKMLRTVTPEVYSRLDDINWVLGDQSDKYNSIARAASSTMLPPLSASTPKNIVQDNQTLAEAVFDFSLMQADEGSDEQTPGRKAASTLLSFMQSKGELLTILRPDEAGKYLQLTLQ